jgi:hypothetical protein
VIIIQYLLSEHKLLAHSSMMEEFWTATAAALQIYCIRLSREKHEKCSAQDMYESTLISPTDSDVGLFEKISFCQLIPAVFTLLNSVMNIYFGISLFGDLGSVPLMLDACGNLLFYVKVMIINERSNLTVELIPV